MILNIGSKGQDVINLQNNLLKLGYKLPKFGSDGSYGNETKDAIIQLQKDYNLNPIDGIVGSITSTAINKLLDKKEQNILEKVKQFVYKFIGTTHVLEVDINSIRAMIVNESGKSILSKIKKGIYKFKSFINGNFFSYGNPPKTHGWLMSEGIILTYRLEHPKYDKPKGTFIVYKNGKVEVGLKTDGDMEIIKNDIWFCCQGFNLFPINLSKEGYTYGGVGYSTNRISIGYNPEKNIIVIAGRSNSDAYRTQKTMINLGCANHAICLDSGGSANFVYNVIAKFLTNRTLSNIIYC